MAKLTNTFVSSDAVGNRPDISDIVSRITPEDTPIVQFAGFSSCKSTHPEWEVDELAAPADNAQLEGDEFDFDAITAPDRVGNYTQIFRKSWILSETQEAVDNAGQHEKIRAQKVKKGIEIRKDIEYAVLTNQGSVAIDPRRLGSLASWYETNVSRGSGGANGGFNDATGLTEAATGGTQRTFTKSLLDDTLQQVYQSGGRVRHAICSPYVKSVFTTFMSDSNVAQFRYSAPGEGQNTIIATADIYESDFGKVSIVPNRVQNGSAAMASNVHLIDPAMLSIKMLRKIQPVADVAKTGDAIKGVMVGEGTLCVRNEKGLGVIADVFGLTASS